jgi:hypothetical protein
MTNLKCFQCGAVNLVANETCKVCGVELQPLPPESETAAEFIDEIPRVAPLADDLIGPFLGVSSVLSPTFILLKENFWLITKIVFVIMAPFELLRILSTARAEDAQLAAGVVLLQYLSNALVVPALFYALMKVMQTGIAPGVNEAYRWGLGKIPKLALTAIMSAILTGLGTLLCIIPGIIIGVGLFIVYPIAIFEKGSATKALERSWQLTKGHRWNIAGASIITGILVGIVAWPAAALIAYLAVQGTTLWPLQAAIAIASDIVTETGTILTLVVYLSILRTLESGQSIIE